MSEAKIKQTRLLLNLKQVILIKNSETPKDSEVYGNLFHALQEYDKLSELDLGLSNSFDSKAVAVLTNEQIKNILMQNIIDEWFAVEYYEAPGQKIPCQLCHTPNKYIYYIRNRNNENELHIGSECRKQFPGIDNIQIVRKDYRDKELARNENIRRTEFGELEIEDPDYVLNASKNFNDFNILLPYVLYNNMKQILYDLNFIKTDYIKSGGDVKGISVKYKMLKLDYTKLWEQAIDFNKYNKNNKLICNKYMSDWLKDKHPEIWEKVSRNDGLFDVETLKFAYNSKFVLKHLPQFVKRLNDNSIKIISVTENSIRFKIENNIYHYPVSFTMTNKLFMESIGCLCLTNPVYLFDRTNLKNITIENNRNNLDALYNRMMKSMNNIGLAIDFDDYSSQIYYKRLPRILKKSAWSDKFILAEVGYKRIADGQFSEICKPLLFSTDNNIEKLFEQVLYKLEQGTVWITQNQRDEMNSRAKEMSLQQQREFI